MKTIIDANITRDEFKELFGNTDGVVAYDNYLSLGYSENHCLYHLSLLFALRGETREAEKFRQFSGMPPAYQLNDYDF